MGDIENVIKHLIDKVDSDGRLILNQEETSKMFRWLDATAKVRRDQHKVIKTMANILRREYKNIPQLEDIL